MAFYAEAASKSFGSQRPNGNGKPAYPRHPAPGKGPVNQSGKPKGNQKQRQNNARENGGKRVNNARAVGQQSNRPDPMDIDDSPCLSRQLRRNFNRQNAGSDNQFVQRNRNQRSSCRYEPVRYNRRTRHLRPDREGDIIMIDAPPLPKEVLQSPPEDNVIYNWEEDNDIEMTDA